jgi:hypothetical protein
VYPAGTQNDFGGFLYCQSCGSRIDGELCANCGKARPTLPPPLQALASAHAASYSPPSDLVGVYGWLLFLCVALTLLHPISCLDIASKAARNSVTTHSITLTTLFRLLFVTSFYVGLALYSFTAGLKLFRRVPGAVRFTKNYLVISTISVLTLQSILYGLGLHIELGLVFVGRIGYFLLWYSYLLTSRRVEYTYPQG